MSKRSRKYSLKINPESSIEAPVLFHKLKDSYDIQYLGVYKLKGDQFIYIHLKNTVIGKNLKARVEYADIYVEEIKPCLEFSGTMKSDYGTRLSRGRKRRQEVPNITNIHNIDNSVNNTTNNINVIMVNPLGEESLDHITPEYIQSLLSNTEQDANVVFQFGTKLYSIPENMNFISSLKVGYVKALLPGTQRAWLTRPKEDAFETLVENLSEKNRELVELYGDIIPKEHMDRFKLNLGWIEEFSKSFMPEDQLRYKRFRNEGMNSLAENISDKKRRIQRDTNSVLRLE